MSNVKIKLLNTEKTHKLQEWNIYTFSFPKMIRKNEIKEFIEKKYAVKIDDVRILNLPKRKKVFRGVLGVMSNYKKAYIKVAKGMKIDIENNNSNKKE